LKEEMESKRISGICVLVLLSVCAIPTTTFLACRPSRAASAIAGSYTARWQSGAEHLNLLRDGTYVHTYNGRTQGSSVGRWRINGDAVCLGNWVVYVDDFGYEQRAPFETISENMVWIRGSRWSPRFMISPDLPEHYEKNDSPEEE